MFQSRSIPSLPKLFCVAATLATPAIVRAELPIPYSLADYAQANICPRYHKLENNACAPVITEIDTLNDTACSTPNLHYANKKCTPVKPTIQPTCTTLQGFTATNNNGSCTYAASSQKSGAGDFIGDCFRTAASIPGTETVKDTVYLVTSQVDTNDNDRTLTMIKGELLWRFFGCKSIPSNEPPIKLSAHTLIESGASRLGYTYGFLTMPYKYYSNGTIASGSPIGAYFGLRRGRPGSGVTYALAATLGSVKANTIDPATTGNQNPTTTGTTDVPAISIAAGLMFDVLKSPQGKPFKIGGFVGRDRVSKSNTIQFKENGKTWIAFQIGYDFTDN